MKTCAHGLICLGCACIIVADLLVNAMDESGMTRFLVDGFPRTLDQLQDFEEKVWEGMKSTCVA